MEVAPSGFTVERIDCVVLRAFPDGEVLSGRNLAVKEVVRLSGLKLQALSLCTLHCHCHIAEHAAAVIVAGLAPLLADRKRAWPGCVQINLRAEHDAAAPAQSSSRQIRYVPAGTAAPLSSLRSQKKPACPLWAWRRLRRRCCHPSFSEDLPQQPRTSGSQGASHTLCALR